MKVTLALAFAVIAVITINHVMAQTQSGTAGFIANPTNNNTVFGTADPNYNTYQNLASGFSIKYLKNMTISEKINNTQHFVTFKTPSGKPLREGIVLAISVILENNFLGQQYSLDKTVRNACCRCRE